MHHPNNQLGIMRLFSLPATHQVHDEALCGWQQMERRWLRLWFLSLAEECSDVESSYLVCFLFLQYNTQDPVMYEEYRCIWFMVLEARELKNTVPVPAWHLVRAFLLKLNVVDVITQWDREHYANLGLSYKATDDIKGALPSPSPRRNTFQRLHLQVPSIYGLKDGLSNSWILVTVSLEQQQKLRLLEPSGWVEIVTYSYKWKG